MTPEAKAMCSAALAYAGLGWAVLPVYGVANGKCRCGKVDCSSPGKHPHGRFAPHGVNDATRDGALICSWFQNGEAINVAIQTGAESGIVVLDIDDRHGGSESVRAFGELPQTATAQTGGGWHPYFNMPDGIDLRNSAGKLGPGLDVRATGGYVVAPPSTHISGRQYKWLRDPRAGLADLPKSILHRLTGMARKPRPRRRPSAVP